VVDFDVLNSKYFGVPQNRERIFIVAIREDLIEAETFSEESTTGQTIVPKGKRRIGEWAKTFNFDWPEQAEVTTRLHDILESNVDEKYYLVEEKTAKLVAQLEKRESPQVLRPQRTEYGKAIRKKCEAGEIKESRHNMTELQPRKDGISNTLTTVEKDNWLAEPRMLGHVDIRGNDSIKRTYSTEGISPTLTTMGGGHREPKIAVLGNVSNNGHNNENVHDKDGICPTITARDYKGAKLVAEEQGLPIREATKKGYAIAEEGDSVNVQFPDSKTRRGRVGKQIANTLETSSINQGVVESPPKYRIRKLTPLECWRLQGFSDEAHEAVKQAGISDSQRYKQAGNAVTVNVIEAISERLIPLIAS